MADPKKNPLIGAFRAPVPGAPPDTPAPPEAGKPPAAGAAKPIDEKKGQEAPKAPAGTTPKPTDGKKEPEAPKTPVDPFAKPANEKKGQEAPKAPADTSAKPADGKKEPEALKAPADPLTKLCRPQGQGPGQPHGGYTLLRFFRAPPPIKKHGDGGQSRGTGLLFWAAVFHGAGTVQGGHGRFVLGIRDAPAHPVSARKRGGSGSHDHDGASVSKGLDAEKGPGAAQRPGQIGR